MSQSYALVTGASSGIGAHIARELAARGRPVILVARRRQRLEALAEDIASAHGVSTHIIEQDLATPGAADALHQAVQADGLTVDVLINNAGFGMQGPLLDMEMGRIEEMIHLNVVTLTRLTQLCARDMANAGGGHILQVASAAAFLPSPYVAAYAATKHYVLAFSEAIRYELRRHGVSVTTLYPGITRTEFNAVAQAKTPSLMNLSILDADVVARVGVNALFKGKRAAIPGLINKINAFFSHVLHRGMVTHTAGFLLEAANRPPHR